MKQSIFGLLVAVTFSINAHASTLNLDLTDFTPSAQPGGAGAPGVEFDGGTANLGRFGTPGMSSLTKDFDLTAGQVYRLDFSRDWEFNEPLSEDTFKVSFGGETIFTETSTAGFAAGAGAVSATFTAGAGDEELAFTLSETNVGSPGTFVALSAASLTAVPIPAAAWLFGSAVIGLGAVNRRRVS